MKKNILLLLFVFLIPVFLVCAGCNEKNSGNLTLDSMPKKYSKDVLENELLINAVQTGDGYLRLDGFSVEKYSLDGNLVWKKDYLTDESADFVASDTNGRLAVTSDGGFVFAVSSASYEDIADKIVGSVSVLIKCNRNGKQIWKKSYRGFGEGAICGLFALPNGNIITAANTGSDGLFDDIYFSLLNKKGKLIKQEYHGGSKRDTILDIQYVENEGLIAKIESDSNDGTFSKFTKDEYFSGVAVMFNFNLEIIWHSAISFDQMIVLKDKIYACNYQNRLLELDYYGEVREIETYPSECYASIVDCNEKPVVQLTRFEGDEYKSTIIQFYDGQEMQSMPFDGGDAVKIIFDENYFLIISLKNIGIHEMPSYLSSVVFNTEYVYSLYDYDFNLLCSETFENRANAQNFQADYSLK